MESPPPSSSRPLLVSSLCIVVAVGVGSFIHFTAHPARLESPPSAVRPWAEERFLKLTAPVPSTGKATDPQYLARHGGPLPPNRTDFKIRVVVEPASIEFVPKYEVIEFDAAAGFTSKTGSGKIRWLAAKPYDLSPDPDPSASVLTPFHPDGKPMAEDEAKALGITDRDLEAWGLEMNGEIGTALKGFLELEGFRNLQWKLQDIFDADTHVSVMRLTSVSHAADGLGFGAALSVLHDAPLVAVLDLAHGETQDFQMPVSKGASVNHADFRIEVIEVIQGTVDRGGSSLAGSGATIEQHYGIGKSTTSAGSFSVIYQINPPVMATAVSVDAIDAAGQEIRNLGKFMEHAPVSKFEAPLASAASLRVQFRPHQTRLLLKMKSLPGVTAPNLKPADLFDVTAPKIHLRDPFQMRRAIAAGAQLKDISRMSYDTPADFPITLSDASLREVAARALESRRMIKVDPVAMTIEFEPPENSTWTTRAVDWFKSLPWFP